MRHLGFTGTRLGMTDPQRTTVRRYLSALHGQGFTWLHHGDCVGADEEAHAIWTGLAGMVHVHPGKLPGEPGRAMCQADVVGRVLGPLIRNVEIIETVSALVAAPGTEGEVVRSGTWATVRAALRLGRWVVVCTPSGEHHVLGPSQLSLPL